LQPGKHGGSLCVGARHLILRHGQRGSIGSWNFVESGVREPGRSLCVRDGGTAAPIVVETRRWNERFRLERGRSSHDEETHRKGEDRYHDDEEERTEVPRRRSVSLENESARLQPLEGSPLQEIIPVL